MKHAISTVQSRVLDKVTRETLAIDDLLLMEKASLRLWDLFRTLIEKEQPNNFIFVCGKGDNGGDGLAVARHAWSSGVEKARMQVVVPQGQEAKGESFQRQLASLKGIGIAIQTWEYGCLENYVSQKSGKTAIIDAVLGTGASGKARGTALAMIDGINSLTEKLGKEHAVVIAIDIPSGLGDSWMKDFPIVRADYTLTLAPAKIALFFPDARSCAGQIFIADDVFPLSFVQSMAEGSIIEADAIRQAQIYLAGDAYKISRGRVAVLAGAVGTLGAAFLSCKATQAAGAGYVQFFIQDEAYAMAAPALPAVMTRAESVLETDSLKADSILAGPGWGKTPEHGRILEKLLRLNIPLVLDADALRILAESGSLAMFSQMQNRTAPLILTPHPGEFAALVQHFIPSQENLPFGELLEQLAEKLNAIIVYKSHVTWICSPKAKPSQRFSIWDGQCPGLGTAGSGDILAGFLAGDLALRCAVQKNKAVDTWTLALQSTIHAVACHGDAGRRLYTKAGWFSAAELLPILKVLSCEAVENTTEQLDGRQTSR